MKVETVVAWILDSATTDERLAIQRALEARLVGAFVVGDRVSFEARGRTIIGVITRRNQKTMTVEPVDGGRGWRVPPRLLRRVGQEGGR